MRQREMYERVLAKLKQLNLKIWWYWFEKDINGIISLAEALRYGKKEKFEEILLNPEFNLRNSIHEAFHLIFWDDKRFFNTKAGQKAEHKEVVKCEKKLTKWLLKRPSERDEIWGEIVRKLRSFGIRQDYPKT